MNPRILGLGTSQPPTGLNQRQAVDMALGRCCTTDRHARLLPSLYRRTGVQTRRAVALACDITDLPDALPDPDPDARLNGRHVPVPDPGALPDPADPDAAPAATSTSTTTPTDEQAFRFYPLPADDGDRGPSTAARMKRYAQLASPLAAEAARCALADAALPPTDITHLVTCSCTGFHAPGVDVALVKTLNLPPSVGRTHVGFMGCHGAFNALAVARHAALANPRARVLVVAVELCSLHFGYGFDPQQVVANALFADGAAALVLAGDDSPNPDPNPDPSPQTRNADAPDHARRTPRLVDAASRLFQDCEDAMTWIIGDHGFRMTLEATVPALIQQQLADWLVPWLAQHDLDLQHVGGWAIHPGGPRILDAVADALQLHPHAANHARAVLRDAGNMSSATILFILQRMIQDPQTRRPIVALGFGPGLIGEAMLIQ